MCRPTSALQHPPKKQKRVTELTINLGHLHHNYALIRQQLRSTTKMIAVVKANAYGLGSEKIAKTLVELGADWLAVAYVSEGIALRNAGIDTPIMVFYPQFEHLAQLIDYQLEPVLYSPSIIQEFSRQLNLKQVHDYPVHLKCNTGLNRIGLSPQEIISFFSSKNDSPFCVQTVYSHLGASENKRPCRFTQQQIDRFLTVKTSIEEITSTPPLFHLLNTSGVFNYPELQMDVVRTGIGLYGFANRADWNKNLTPIAELRTRIVQIHSLEKGDNVGYNLGFIAQRRTRIAVLPIGHADGITRQYGKGKGHFFLHGHAVPIVGQVCMDMLMIDVTDVPCQLHDPVVVFNTTHRADALAENAGTIAYELLTGLSPRLSRRYQ